MPFVLPFVIVVVLVVFAFGVIYSLIQARKRREGLFELAQRLGLNFSAAEDYELADRYNFLKQLAQGENRYARNALSGTWQQNLVLALAFDRCLSVEQVESNLQRLVEIRSRLPEYLFKNS
jgi:hypothetical protein